MSDLNDRLLEAVSDRLATAKNKREYMLQRYKLLLLLISIGLAILALLVFLAMNQERHERPEVSEAEKFCLELAWSSQQYETGTDADKFNLQDHEKYHECVKFHREKDSELLDNRTPG